VRISGDSNLGLLLNFPALASLCFATKASPFYVFIFADNPFTNLDVFLFSPTVWQCWEMGSSVGERGRDRTAEVVIDNRLLQM